MTWLQRAEVNHRRSKLADVVELHRPFRCSPKDSLQEVHWITLDVETTGLSPTRGHRIWEVAFVDEFGGELVTTIRPNTPRAYRRAFLGSTADLYHAPTFADIADEVARWLRRGVTVGHNVLFDLQFLRAELNRCGGRKGEVWFVDTVHVAHRLGLPTRLRELALALELEVPPVLHRALEDARLTRTVLDVLIKRAAATRLRDVRVRRLVWGG